jgi:predicted ArsR family transcriptional regulator
MLSQVLELLQTGGTHRVIDLARSLNTTPQLVEVMLDDLSRMGYLQRIEGECSDTCDACPMAGLCAAGSSGQLWTLTAKGNSA